MKRGERDPARWKQVDGLWYKKCSGPLHNGEYLPESRFYTERVKRAHRRSRCRECESFVAGTEAWVRITELHENWIEELVHRVGVMETARRLGRSQHWLWRVRHKRIHRMRKATLRRIIVVLRASRDSGEARHRDSILRGTTVRGEAEKVPTQERDFYHPLGRAKRPRAPAKD